MRIKAKYVFTISILIISTYYINVIVSSISPNLPRPAQKPILYSNQMRQDLKMTCFKALKKAKSHIHLVMFGLTDYKIIDILNKKSKKNLDMHIFYDKRSRQRLEVKPHQQTLVKTKGLMHQKILVIDKKLVFLGSANFTTSSFLMHDNLIIGFYSPEVAKFLCQKTPYFPGNISAIIGGQKIDIWLLPDFQNKAINKIIELINSAATSIEVAMFTLTHPHLVNALIAAKNRGVNVQVAIDFQSKNGASRKAIEKLEREKITILFNREIKLCHHKYISIDQKTLLLGSANWTKSAFNKNYDCFLILYNIDRDQKRFLKRLWKILTLESTMKKLK